jgi:hypothetical protein
VCASRSTFAHAEVATNTRDARTTYNEGKNNFMLYWLTNSATSVARLYWENGGRSATSAAAQMTNEISVPVAITVFPEEVYRPRRHGPGAPFAT